MNARGIPTMLYQVLHLLPDRIPPWLGPTGGYLRWGTPLARVPPTRSDGLGI